MTNIVPSEQDKIRLCKDLGFSDPSRVMAVDIHIEPGDIVRVTAHLILAPEVAERLFNRAVAPEPEAEL